jgi:hypothetical protein
VVEARDGIEDQVRAIVKEAMKGAFEKIIPEVPFIAVEIRADEEPNEKLPSNINKASL